jgi:hypothetical protein
MLSAGVGADLVSVGSVCARAETAVETAIKRLIHARRINDSP